MRPAGRLSFRRKLAQLICGLPRPAPPARLAIMHRIDAPHLVQPFAGSQMLRDRLRLGGLTTCPLAMVTYYYVANRYRGAVSLAEHVQALSGPQDLPVSAAQGPDRSAEPGLGNGRPVYPDGARLRLSGCGGRPVQPIRSGLAVIHHAEDRVRHRCHAGGIGPLWQAGDRRHQPGQPVHRRGCYGYAAGADDLAQHGWSLRPICGMPQQPQNSAYQPAGDPLRGTEIL
jgi:hypothetical protein